MVAFILVLLVESEHNLYLTLPAAVIIGREITIASLREWMAEIGQRARIKVSSLGKWKTTTQMLAITLLLYGEDLWGLPIMTGGYCLLYIAAALTLWSMTQYLIAAMATLKK
jgi:CDP-diacylglycerol--glycerol-3-phosphate 3-phosphatidyltransferase